MASLTIEEVYGGELPSGFQSTLAESDRLRELSNVEVKLDDTVEDWGGNTLTEGDVIRKHVQGIMTAFRSPEAEGGATLELAATAVEFTRILAFAQLYKNDNDTPSGTIKTPQRADPDDIVFSFATPEVYEEVSGTPQNTFRADGLAGGSQVEIVGDSGLNETNPSAGASLDLDADERMYFTGDIPDLSSGQSVLSKYQWSDIDGESYGQTPSVLQNRYSPLHAPVAQGAHVKSTADLDAKAYDDGNAEPVPIAFYMGPGSKAPSLV